ncbi:hypothetical protein [Mycobacterium canetti]|uniref:hypothetical protein n=2 Tax=Mycobacterium canetti TaxID=78331 RepID=UPI00031AEA1F|nr:hypothetical protein [Mycobacterium canetti]
MGLMGPHPNAVALLVDPVVDVVGEELGVWLAAPLPAVVRGQLRRREGVRNLRRRRLRLGNRSYLQQLIRAKIREMGV